MAEELPNWTRDEEFVLCKLFEPYVDEGPPRSLSLKEMPHAQIADEFNSVFSSLAPRVFVILFSHYLRINLKVFFSWSVDECHFIMGHVYEWGNAQDPNPLIDWKHLTWNFQQQFPDSIMTLRDLKVLWEIGAARPEDLLLQPFGETVWTVEDRENLHTVVNSKERRTPGFVNHLYNWKEIAGLFNNYYQDDPLQRRHMLSCKRRWDKIRIIRKYALDSPGVSETSSVYSGSKAGSGDSY